MEQRTDNTLFTFGLGDSIRNPTMVPLKRRRVCDSNNVSNSNNIVKFQQQVVFLLERRMGGSRRSFLSQLGRGKGFHIEERFSESVTHVISENNSGDEVRAWLDSQEGGQGARGGQSKAPPVCLLDISWFTESMHEGRPVEIQDRHILQEQQKNREELPVFSVPSYACQRRTTLHSHNLLLSDALSVLADSAEFGENEGRCVAFRRAVAVLNFLPKAVTAVEQLRGLPSLGEHSLRVIQEILEDGVSREVESTKRSDQYKAMKVLTGIFGVGVKTADRWFRQGIHSLAQLEASGQALNHTQQAGVQYYTDLNQPVTKAEADVISHLVDRAVSAVLPGAQITLIGGFRRGKVTGHDVDFLITHPEEGKEEGLIYKVVAWLESQGFLLYQKITKNSYLESKEGPRRPASTMDRFERCFSIFRLDQEEERSETHTLEGRSLDVKKTQSSGSRPWRAVRVDLVISPMSQFAFALLGWTGSKLFERDLRRWAGHEKSMSLSSHALFDIKQGKYLRAGSEEEIFTHLGLDYIPPSERNA